MAKRTLFGSFVVCCGAIAALLAGTTREAQAQAAVITGRVSGGPDQPLGGASVIIREVSSGRASTAADGSYTMTVAAEHVRGQQVTLTARYPGYSPGSRTITLTSGRQTQDFDLRADLLRLEEIVVTGTAEETSTRMLGFSVGTVSEATLQEVPATNPIQALSGKVAGAHVVNPGGQPGSATTLRLRSATSLTPGASQQPLLVVDGIITYGTLADINVGDIERIEVVKGAAASSLYGSNAAGGVVQVFTRRGRNVPDGATRVTVRNEAGRLGLNRRLPINRSHYYQLDGSGNYLLDENGDKQLELDHVADNPYPASTPFRDQQDLILGNGLFYTNYVGVGRRLGQTNFQASFENQQNYGIIDIPGVSWDGFGRRNARINVDHTISDRLDFSIGAFFNESHSQEFQEGVGSPFFSVLFMPPDVDLTDSNTNGEPFRADVGTTGAITSTDRNPLYTAANTDLRRARTRVQGNLRMQWRPIEWLGVEGYFGYDRQTDDFRNYVPKGTLSSSAVPGLGSLNLNNSNRRAYNAGVSATIRRRWQDLNWRVKFSGTLEDDLENTTTAGASDFASVGVPDLDNLSNQGTKTIGSSQIIRRARNVFAIAGFEYRDRYIADVLVRRDGSSLFGADARYATYYRVSGAYRLTEDIRLPGVQELRLRASRGTAGLRPPFEAQYETFTTTGGQIAPRGLGNRDLKPAHSTENELGFNVDFLNRFTFEYSYSHKVTEDQVLPVPLSSVAGFTSQWRNAGTLEGSTHELAFGAVLADRANWSWRVNVTADRTRMEVTDLTTAAFTSGSGQQSNDVFLIREGVTYGSMWGYRFVHTVAELSDNPANAALDPTLYSVNEDGYVVLTANRGTSDERAIKYVDADGNSNVQIGDANPDFTMALSTTLRWRNFTFYGLLDWVRGGDIYNLPRQWLSRAEFRAAEIDQAGKPALERKAIEYYSAINDANNFNEFYVEDGGYRRLRELAVSYQVSPRTLERAGLSRMMRSLRLGVVGRNLVTWTNYSGLDPETHNPVTSSNGDPTTFRFDSFGYPNFRTFSAMVEIGF
ncbi:MAG: SusC/RagA family TonB-linked outer membrane protein [Gemmatimonadales bacterium]|nr:SusC/RagA family TonB-linked outer membrane protein [Gemmatimonadales bacterium]